MISKVNRKENRARRHKRVRKHVNGTAEIPRLAVSKSNKNIYAQLIDDEKQETIAFVSTLQKEVKEKKANKIAAQEIGTLIAKKAKEKKIEKAVFDRGGYLYHGVVKEIAEAARQAGLEI